MPSGKSISEVGVSPDIFVEEEGKDFKLNSPSDNQLSYAVKLLKSDGKNKLPLRVGVGAIVLNKKIKFLLEKEKITL